VNPKDIGAGWPLLKRVIKEEESIEEIATF
jgi:hypothetical protein